MLVEPAIAQVYIQPDNMHTQHQRFSFLDTLQGISCCYVVAMLVDRVIMHNQLTISSLWAITGFTTGLLVKKVISVYTSMRKLNAQLLEINERYPYAFRVAMIVSILSCFLFPTFGTITTTSLGFFSGFIFDLQAF